jgi:transglutaminase/protease-like cytokinesis protein 3
MKFANLEIIRERNIFSYSLDASKKKVACINSFYNFIRYVDDKEILNEEIKIEFARRNKEQSVHIYRRALRKAGRIVKKILKR